MYVISSEKKSKSPEKEKRFGFNVVHLKNKKRLSHRMPNRKMFANTQRHTGTHSFMPMDSLFK